MFSVLLFSSPNAVTTFFESPISWNAPLIGHAPRLEPLEVGPLGMGSLHTEGDGSEHPEQSNDDSVEDSVDAVLHSARETARDPVGAESETEDSKVKSRVVVVDVGDTTHGHERCVMQNPTDDGVDTGVVDLINVLLGQLVVTALPANQVVGDQKTESGNRSSTGPVDERVTKKEVLDNVVVPAAHAETDIEERPLPRSRGQVILLVRVRDKGVV